MSVIINDFEVVVEDSQQEEAPTEQAEPPPASSMISPLDIQNVLERHQERQARLWAH